jgi:ataxia telangiectasia mutated family protein
MRKKLEEIQIKDHNSSELPKRYTELITKFKPVMRHYFTEKHREPMAWFSMRLNYLRSVAVTSIVGHILGIGDRHCSNILIDKLTGELVHIDFGIVFEDVSLIPT